MAGVSGGKRGGQAYRNPISVLITSHKAIADTIKKAYFCKCI